MTTVAPVARMERSGMRGHGGNAARPGFRFAPSGVRLLRVTRKGPETWTSV
jgi:hypothetical protein